MPDNMTDTYKIEQTIEGTFLRTTPDPATSGAILQSSLHLSTDPSLLDIIRCTPFTIMLPLLYTILHMTLIPDPTCVLSRAFLVPLSYIVCLSFLADFLSSQATVALYSVRPMRALEKRASMYKQLMKLGSAERLRELKARCADLEGFVAVLNKVVQETASAKDNNTSGLEKRKSVRGKQTKGETGLVPQIMNYISVLGEARKELKKVITVREMIQPLFERGDLEEEMMYLVEETVGEIRVEDEG